MYTAILNDDNRVVYVVNSEGDEAVGPQVPEDVFQQIWLGGAFGDWVFINDSFIFDPQPKTPPQRTATPPSGEIPTEVL